MAAKPTPFPAKSASADQTSFEANLAQHRLSLRQNHYCCEQLRAQLHSLSPKLFGWGHRKQLLTMINELAALGEKLSCDLQEALRHFQGLDASVQKHREDVQEITNASARIRSLKLKSTGEIEQQNELTKHTYWERINTTVVAYNQKIWQMEDWRRKGTLRLFHMWCAEIPTWKELPQALNLHLTDVG
jgi:hypothetical protein